MYVYYRLAGEPHAAVAVVRALFDDVAARTGVQGTLLRRCDDPATWMEVFAPITDLRTFRDALDACERRAQASAIAVQGVRHRECFAPLVPGAG